MDKPEGALTKINFKLFAQQTEQQMMSEKDEIYVEKVRKVPHFIKTLTASQQRILYSVVQLKLPLKIFFISINERQLTDFHCVHADLRDDTEQQLLLTEISHNYPNKLILNGNDTRHIDQVTVYISQIRKTVDRIKLIKTFFYLTELPSEYIDKIGLDQLQLYGDIVNQVKYCAQLEIDKE